MTKFFGQSQNTLNVLHQVFKPTSHFNHIIVFVNISNSLSLEMDSLRAFSEFSVSREVSFAYMFFSSLLFFKSFDVGSSTKI